MHPQQRLTFFAFLLIAGLAACSSLEPIELPPQTAFAPADATTWDAIDEVVESDWTALLNDGPTALDWRLRAIDTATRSIDLQTFLWSFDVVGAMVLDHLVSAADRGVRVRLLIDDTFLLGEDTALLALQRHANVEYRVFNPYKRRSDGYVSRLVLNLGEFHRLDHRMHNKAMVVDNRIAIVGGRNLAEEYFGLHEEANFRDMELIVGGPVVPKISDAFDKYWNDRWAVPIDMLSHLTAVPASLDEARRISEDTVHVHAEETPVGRDTRWRSLVAAAHRGQVTLFADDPPAENPADANSAPVQVANELIEIFNSARRELLIASAYLIPTPHLEGAVEQAVERGVNVQILTNSIGSNNHLTAHSAYRNHIDTLLGYGARLHEVRTDARDRARYMATPVADKALALHAKTLAIDGDRVFVGSVNLDPRSLRINTEMGLLVESESLNAEIRNAIESDLDRANAWELQFDEDGRTVWLSDTEIRTSQPALSSMQRLEDWFFAHLPLEGEL